MTFREQLEATIADTDIADLKPYIRERLLIDEACRIHDDIFRLYGELKQVMGEICKTCGWAFIIGTEPCANCERHALRAQLKDEIEERDLAWKRAEELAQELENHCETCPKILALQAAISKAQPCGFMIGNNWCWHPKPCPIHSAQP